MLFAVLSLLVHVPSDVYANDGGTITEVDSLEHDAANGRYNSLVQVDSDTYALAYSGEGEDGFISTFTISADGTTITEVESLEHDTTYGLYNSLVQVDSDTYALAYFGSGGDGFISTFDIDSTGDITPIRVANHATLGEGSSVNLEHDTTYGKENSLVQVDSDTYALAYAGSGSDGYISTFTISADGTTITEVESLEHDAANGRFNSLVQVDSGTYALAYVGEDDDGFISTFDIDSTGDITPIRVANHATLGEGSSVNLEHDTVYARYNSLVQVDSDTYALAYTGSGSDGFISTFTIPSDGSSITEVDSLEHDTALGYYNSLVQVDSDTYALAYAGAGYDGFISTFTISSDGTITAVKTQSLGNNLEHDTTSAIENSLVQVDSDTYALAYTGDGFGAGYDGYISTFTISATVTTSTSDSICNDCTAPSLGISNNHTDPVRVIDDGITFNEKSFDVREFAKIYDTIDTETGVTNTIQLKIYEDSKPENVRKAILYLGLDSSDIHRNLACIIWETNSYGEKTITIVDKFDLFENESATATIDGDILLLDYTFTSKIPIPTSTMAVELRDDKYNFGLNYFENVIKVSGNPLHGTGTFSKNNSVQTLIVDTFQNESSDSQNGVTSPEFESNAPFEIPSIMIADTSQWGFSDTMTQRYLADIEETIQQNDSKIQAMRNADTPLEIPIFEHKLPRIEENLLQIEQEKAQLVVNKMLRGDIHNWKKIYDPQTFEIDVKQVSALTGMSYDSLHPWMSNLETWVAEGTIDSSELVIVVEYLTNN
jgi:hypothetical protein